MSKRVSNIKGGCRRGARSARGSKRRVKQQPHVDPIEVTYVDNRPKVGRVRNFVNRFFRRGVQ